MSDNSKQPEVESALHIGQVQTEKNIFELQSNLPSPSGPPFIFPL